MKTKILTFILLAFICIAASVTTTNLIKPAMPKHTVVFTKGSNMVSNAVISYVNQGYQVQLITGTQNYVTVVMVKY